MKHLKTSQELNEASENLNISDVMYSYSDLIGKKCKRKGSNTVWEIWAADKDGIAVMNYSQYKPMSRRITITNFIKSWEIL